MDLSWVQLRVIIINMFEQGFLLTFLAFGVLMTFRFFRFPDLTAEASYPLGGTVVATLLVLKVNPFWAIGIAVLAGVVAGVITSLIHTKLRINPIIAGIITLTATYSIMLRIMGRSNIPLLRITTVYEVILAPVERFLGYPLVQTGRSIGIIIFLGVLLLIIALLFYWFLRTDLGLAVRATGENPHMISGLGVNTDTTKLIGVAISNGLIALSGALVAQDHGFADVQMGVGVLVAGAAAVLIGQSIFGDRTAGWWIVASITGILIYRLLVGLALRAGLAPTDLRLITAVLLLLALAVPQWRAILLNRREAG
ncbi:MAG: ABC transporter permease [Anaerolineae bacterium]